MSLVYPPGMIFHHKLPSVYVHVHFKHVKLYFIPKVLQINVGQAGTLTGRCCLTALMGQNAPLHTVH